MRGLLRGILRTELPFAIGKRKDGDANETVQNAAAAVFGSAACVHHAGERILPDTARPVRANRAAFLDCGRRRVCVRRAVRASEKAVRRRRSADRRMAVYRGGRVGLGLFRKAERLGVHVRHRAENIGRHRRIILRHGAAKGMLYRGYGAPRDRRRGHGIRNGVSSVYDNDAKKKGRSEQWE